MLPQSFPFLFFIKRLGFQKQRQFLSGIPLFRCHAGCIVHVQFTQPVLLYPVENGCVTDPGLSRYLSHTATTTIKCLTYYGRTEPW